MDNKAAKNIRAFQPTRHNSRRMTNDSAGDANMQRKYGIAAKLRGQPANTTRKHHAQMAKTTPLKISAKDGATARFKKARTLRSNSVSRLTTRHCVKNDIAFNAA